MIVCYFGNFDSAYPRNRIIRKGLEMNGVKILECRTRKRGIAGVVELAQKHRDVVGTYNILLVGYSDQRLWVFVARLLSRKPVVWDAFYSVYDTFVSDRNLISPRHPKAWWYWFIDWLNVLLASKVILDTNAHITYFIKMFGASRKKYMRVLVGSDDTVFLARDVSARTPENNGTLNVGFYGKYIPLQGVQYIIEAAHLLRDEPVHFTLVGSGQTYTEARGKADRLALANVEFIGRVLYQELPGIISSFDIVLGIFGESGKTGRVIPNKVYEAAAMGKAIITANTPAIRELFADGKNIVLCKKADAKDLAEKIRVLLRDVELRQKVGRGARVVFETQATPERIGRALVAEFSRLSNRG